MGSCCSSSAEKAARGADRAHCPDDSAANLSPLRQPAAEPAASNPLEHEVPAEGAGGRPLDVTESTVASAAVTDSTFVLLPAPPMSQAAGDTTRGVPPPRPDRRSVSPVAADRRHPPPGAVVHTYPTGRENVASSPDKAIALALLSVAAHENSARLEDTANSVTSSNSGNNTLRAASLQ